ncbi:MAG: uncharacterized protein K0S58_790 [Nitrospira sp.]|jgi:hypothetical protein|nr:uncharacterized protein [Nitrospira sp.]
MIDLITAIGFVVHPPCAASHNRPAHGSYDINRLEGIYGKMTDRATTQRMEVLEWIIVLITIFIAVSFLPMAGH